MQVRRVPDRTGSSIEPPLDDAWDNLAKLRWKAAVVALESGIEVSVDVGFFSIGGVCQSGYYSLVIPGIGGSSCVLKFSDAWTHLNGIAAGARAMARRASSPAVDLPGPGGDAK